jgi:RNA polymerase sigma factor (sigma-70 family)
MMAKIKTVDLADLRHRSPEAYITLLDLYGERSLHIAMQYTGNIDDAQDIVQDTIFKIWKKIDTYNEDKPFTQWYFKILVNTCRDWRKNAFRRLRIRKPLLEFDTQQDNEGTINERTSLSEKII